MDKLRIVTVRGTYTDPAHNRDPGMVEVANQPPAGLEYPNVAQDKLDEDVFIIRTDERDPNLWTGCDVFWRGKRWVIEISQMISNGDGALIALIETDEETVEGIPIQGEKERTN